MNAVRTLGFMLALVTVTLALLLAGATGVGVLLDRLLPEVGLGTGILIGVVALSVCLHFVLGLLGQAQLMGHELDEAELEEADLKELVSIAHRPARRRRSRR
jgi:hypothetical protein